MGHNLHVRRLEDDWLISQRSFFFKPVLGAAAPPPFETRDLQPPISAEHPWPAAQSRLRGWRAGWKPRESAGW